MGGFVNTAWGKLNTDPGLIDSGSHVILADRK